MHVCKLCLLILLVCVPGSHGNQAVAQVAERPTQVHGGKAPAAFQRFSGENADRIQPYSKNPRYWQYKGSPILLLGASDEDNLFNHPDIWPFGIESHLDLMVRCGGNYIRNTMSSRDPGNVWAFERQKGGLYDLNRWNEVYWLRLENLIRQALSRDIIVQIELWDRFDYARAPWDDNPFNPKNNVNYDSGSSGLKEMIDAHPARRQNPFFRTVPELENNAVLLPYQEKYIDKILSITLEFPNVLYCISNETNESSAWSDYWADFIRHRAQAKGVVIHVTEMVDAWDLSHPQHASVIGKPALYTYLDLSQNNHQRGRTHWDNAQALMRRHLIERPRPVNSVKIYGGLTHGGGFEEGTQKFWRNIFGGFASARFHRTSNHFSPAGIGLSPLAQIQLASMRMLADELDVFACRPADELLSRRAPNAAYAFAEAGRQYAVYFPDGGSVQLDLTGASGSFSKRWLHIMHNEWQAVNDIRGGASIELSPPGEGPWVVLIKKID
jgi:hypothetical protein